MGVTGVLVFGATAGAAMAMRLTGNINSIDSDKALSIVERPEEVVPVDPSAGTPLNIVLMGTDDRSGENAALGGEADGVRSDTTMVMHISADRSRVEVVSIPRDSIVDIPKCPTSSGDLAPGLNDTRFNAAFAQGVMYGKDIESGALCTMATIEKLTDVRMDGFVAVDFAGFLNMINALGGVTMCIPNDIYSAKADHLRLSAGEQTLDGATALQYARARTGDGLGDGSDINRIGRQQEMMAAIARGVLAKNLLTDAPELVQFLNAVTQSLTMSSQFSSLTELPGLAYSLRNVDLGGISFRTVPWRSNPADINTVLWTSDADLLWSNMKNDLPLDTPAGGTATPDTAATPPTDAAATSGADSSSTGSSSTAAEAPTDQSTAEQGAADQGTADQGAAATQTPSTEPTEVKDAGHEAFTGADPTANCGATP
jgi:LCP family protein required for cell wall assembly